MQTAEPYITHTWQWRGHIINYAVAGCGPPILFVHGFGASLGHFRRNVPALSQSYKVLIPVTPENGAFPKNPKNPKICFLVPYCSPFCV